MTEFLVNLPSIILCWKAKVLVFYDQCDALWAVSCPGAQIELMCSHL